MTAKLHTVSVVTEPSQEGVDAGRNDVLGVEGAGDVGDEEGQPARDERRHHHRQALRSPVELKGHELELVWFNRI